MSGDVLRQFNPAAGRRHRGFTARRRGGSIAGALFAIVVFLCIAFAWITRDHTPMARLIPREWPVQALTADPLRCRAALASAPWWQVLPERLGAKPWHDRLAANFGLPDWILNNALNGPLYVTARSLDDTRGMLAVTRMSRIGAFVERFNRFFPGVARDPAGGLNLRAVADGQLFYAVRGRTLAMSPSRSALVHALTLPPAEAADNGQFASEVKGMSADDLMLVRVPAPKDSPLAGIVTSLEAGLSIAQQRTVRVRCELKLDPAVARHFQAEAAKSHPLPKPADGILQLSANFGMPLPRFLESLHAAAPAVPALPDAAALNAAGPMAPLATVLTQLAGAAGSQCWLSWRGIEPTAMIPAPDIVAGFDVDAAAAKAAMESVPESPVPISGADFNPRYDAQAGMLGVKLVGGPSIWPSFALRGDKLLFGSNRLEFEKYLAGAALPAQLSEKGCLYVRLAPQAAVQQLSAAAMEFAVVGGIRGYTPQSLAEAAKGWSETAGRVEEVLAGAALDEGVLRLELVARFAAPPAV